MRIYLTPPEVADTLGVNADKVRTWILAGELRAVDLSIKQGGRPRWKISEDDLESFLSRRIATPPPKPTRRRKRQPENVIEFY